MTASETTRVRPAFESRPAAPVGDDRHQARAPMNQVLARSLIVTDELRAITSRHVDAAPASCEHVSELTAVTSRTMLDWIERWPS